MGAGVFEQFQKGLYAHLRASIALQALIGNPARVYDEPPKEPVYPFVMIGDYEVQEDGARDLVLYKGTFDVKALTTSHRGRILASRISDVVIDRLHDASFTVTGGKIVMLRSEGSVGDQENDGLTWQSTARFKFILQAF